MNMFNDETNKKIIENYQENERAMILVYAQWCINNDVDPVKLYERAYPDQYKNEVLIDVLEQMVPKRESQEIPYETVIQMLQLYGNDDLAFVIQKEVEKREAQKEENGTL